MLRQHDVMFVMTTGFMVISKNNVYMYKRIQSVSWQGILFLYIEIIVKFYFILVMKSIFYCCCFLLFFFCCFFFCRKKN